MNRHGQTGAHLRALTLPTTPLQVAILEAIASDEERFGVSSAEMDTVLPEGEDLWAWRGRLAVARALGLR